MVTHFTLQVCADPNSWTLNNIGKDATALAKVDTDCTLDYVQIESKENIFAMM